MVEVLHQKGWIRFEVRHGLDQVRLIEGFQALEFLTAAYEGRQPTPTTTPLGTAEKTQDLEYVGGDDVRPTLQLSLSLTGRFEL